MKLLIAERCEQGTPKGVMRFSKGAYAVVDKGDAYEVSHEPRTEKRRVQEGDKTVKKEVAVTSTVVPKAIVEKMVSLGVAKLEV